MRYTILFLLLALLFLHCNPQPDMSTWNEMPQSGFLKSQLQFPRVRDAFQKKEIVLKKLLLEHDIRSFDNNLFLRAFKQEEVLEVWIRPKEEATYRLLKTYDFCKNSGTLGPKRIEGDGQIPEGFYHINHYNPKSSFLLSLKINYPNAADQILSHSTTPGNDIYIHGGCQTIGCIPITNDKIQEVYLLSVLSKQEGRAIPIHIFPFQMAKKTLQQNITIFPQQEAFWKNLKTGFDYFENEKRIPQMKVNASGNYLLKN